VSVYDPQVAGAFGYVLRAARKARGLTQEAVAEIGGFDRSYPSLLERGLRTPTLTSIVRLAEVLGTEPGQLVEQTLVRLKSKGISPPDRAATAVPHS
jgi:transcriptional regulator with XRE-family HTH domain